MTSSSEETSSNVIEGRTVISSRAKKTSKVIFLKIFNMIYTFLIRINLSLIVITESFGKFLSYFNYIPYFQPIGKMIE